MHHRPWKDGEMTAVAIRAFIAIELPPEVQNRIAQAIASLQERGGRAVRWVSTQNIHLTVKFLGNVSPSNLDALTAVLSAEAARHKGFELRVSGLGAFPNKLRPRVVWAGIQAPAQLNELQHGIDRETNRLGYPGEERDFSAHLTLGRVSQHASPQEVKQVADALSTFSIGEMGKVWVDSIRLFRSDLQPGGAIYTPLLSAVLGK
jgi:2'-5' RNA ligase